MSTIKLFTVSAFLLLCMATSCVKGQLVQVKFKLSSCPSKEFLLPLNDLDKDISFLWLEGTTDYEYKLVSKRESREWMNPHFSTYLEFGDTCYFNIITWVSDSSKGRVFDKEDALEIVNRKIDMLDEFAKKLFSKTLFQPVLGPEIKAIENEDVDRIKKIIEKNSKMVHF